MALHLKIPVIVLLVNVFSCKVVFRYQEYTHFTNF